VSSQLTARAEAAAWITRLHGPNRTPEMEAGFRQWLSESAENRIEFEGLTDIWTAVGTLRAGGAPRLERWEHSAESRELQELRSERPASSSRWHPASGSWRKIGLRLVAVAAAVLVFFFVAFWSFRSGSEPSYETGLGEGRMVQLPDKSRVWMNSATRLRVAFDSRQRRVELIRGEALFEVAKHASRPFVVAAGGHSVTALGTSFVVRYESSRTAVTLVEGKVAISPSSAPGDSVPQVEETLRSSGAQVAGSQTADESAVERSLWVLTAGQRLTFVPDSVPKIDEPSVESVLAWRRGEVVLNDTPLAEAVAEMNRYDRTTIVIDGSAVATLNVSGLFHTGDNEGFARSVARMYHLDLHEQDGRIYLKSQ